MQKSGNKVVITTDPEEAAKDADVIYADAWISMGRKTEDIQASIYALSGK